MTRFRSGLVLGFAALALAVTARLSIRAQGEGGGGAGPRPAAGAPGSVQDALLRPFDFPFGKPTPLEEVVTHLSKALNAPVAIDRAALDRQELKADDEVQLVLQGVRLKTGLKLLLDQLDLTYRVVPEDNLLVITDETGSSDPTDRVLTEIKALHRDVHDLQDTVDDLRAALGVDAEGGPKMRKPTIIEEMPPDAEEKAKPKEKPPASSPSSRSRPGA